MEPSKQKTGKRLALEAGAAVLVALGLDILGEPPAAWHPVVWFGKLIGRLEQAAPRVHVLQMLYGAVILLLAAPAAILPAAIVHLLAKRVQGEAMQRGAARGGFLLYALIEGVGLKPCFAVRMLAEAGRSVRLALEQGDVPAARYALRSLVSRECSELTAELVAAAANGLAQAAGIAAIMDRAHLTSTLDKLARERQAFFSALHSLGAHIVPSRTHFCLIEVGDAHAIRQRLLSRRILVRDCTSFGLPQYIRVATRQGSEWQQFVQALREVV